MYQDPEVGTIQMWKIETIEMWNDREYLPLTKGENSLYLHILNRGCKLLLGFQLP
jgi:hypothetical protein